MARIPSKKSESISEGSNSDRFNDEETQRRLEAALRGARIAGHKTPAEIRSGESRKRNLGDGEPKPTKAKNGKPGS